MRVKITSYNDKTSTTVDWDTLRQMINADDQTMREIEMYLRLGAMYDVGIAGIRCSLLKVGDDEN